MSRDLDNILVRLMRGPTGGRWHRHLAAAGIFLAATFAAVLAQQTGWPITAAIVYMLGVTVVGALEGVRGGIVAAIAASLTYNFLLSEPAFRFGFASLDDYVPLFAFNLSAAASGFLAGRLRDRALAAEVAARRIAAFLALSQKLQAAVDPDGIMEAIGSFSQAHDGFGFELHLNHSETSGPSGVDRDALVAALLASGQSALRDGSREALLLASRGGPIGVLVLEWSASSRRDHRGADLATLANLVSITLERCLLLEPFRGGADQAVGRVQDGAAVLRVARHAHAAQRHLRLGEQPRAATSELPDEVREDMLATIREQCERLNRYTTNLLNLGRLQGGVDPQHFTECDALEVLWGRRSRAPAGRRGSGRSRRTIASIPALVRADPVMLEQVFYNVLENAVHYSPERLSHLGRRVREGGHLVVDVVDQGPGIDAGDEERIFNRFYRAKSAVVP